MSNLPPASPNPPPVPYISPGGSFEQDTSHLNTLSIFYFIIAGMQALAAAILFMVVLFFVLGGLLGAAGSRNGDGAGIMGVAFFFACLWAVLPFVLATFSILNYRAATGLRTRKRLTLCYVMAVFACLNFGPLGIVLGVFTFIVLSRLSVKASFT